MILLKSTSESLELVNATPGANSYYFPSDILGSSAPAYNDSGAGGGINMGFAFTTVVAGSIIKGIRYYATGIGIATTPSLYIDGNSTAVATGPAVTSTYIGWVYLPFTTPYALSFGVTYVAAGWNAQTMYTAYANGFPVSEGNALYATPPDAGRYQYTNGSTLPTNHTATWYGIDIVVNAGLAPGPTIKGSTYLSPGIGNTSLTVTPDSSITVGDWMVMVLATLTNSTPTPPSGWTTLQSLTAAGTLGTAIYGKLRTAGETSYTVALNTNGVTSTLYLMWGSGADVVSNWIVGTNMLRASISPTTTFNNVAPSITTTVANTLALAISTERTSVDESMYTSMTGATPYFFGRQSGATQLETTAVGYIKQAGVGNTGNVTIVYPNTQASNGMAIQIGIPPVIASLDVSVSYTEDTSATSVMSSTESKISTVATTPLVPAPTTSSTERVVKLITITNTDTFIAHSITLQKNVAGVLYQEASTFTLLAGEMIQYMDGVGWRYYSSTGSLKTNPAANIVTGQNELAINPGNQIIPRPWTPSAASGSRTWLAITSSSDGKRVIASASDYVFVSTDSGVTWTQQTGSALSLNFISASADGMTIIGARGNSGTGPYISVDGGMTWSSTFSTSMYGWMTVAASGNGKTLIIINGNNVGSISLDAGTTWSGLTAPTQYYDTVAVSYDGTKIVVGGYDYTSTSSDSGVTWVKQPGSNTSPARNYGYIAMSSDGTKIAATSSYIYTSSNSGVTWTEQTSAGYHNWNSIASSADGTKIVATYGTGYIMVSFDGGVTWVPQTDAGALGWVAVTVSYDGTKLYAVASTGYVYSAISVSGAGSLSWNVVNNSVSQLGGASPASTVGPSNPWVQQTTAGSRAWYFIASSADGTKLAAVDISPGFIYTSSDSGATWTAQTSSTSQSWVFVAMSPDGTKLIAFYSGTHYPYTSTDSGVTWTQNTAAGSQSWISAAYSADGARIAAVISGGGVSTSADSGVTWTTRSPGNKSWFYLAMSADGSKIAIVDNTPGYIYTSANYGAAWTQQSASGSRSWNSIASSADGSKLLASDSTGYLYVSSNSGVSWVPQKTAGSRLWNNVASSADGTVLAATGGDAIGAYIYISTNSGQSWTPQISAGYREWNNVTVSANGLKFAAADATPGYIYTLSLLQQQQNSLLLPASATLDLGAWSGDPTPPVSGQGLQVYAEGIGGKHHLSKQNPSGDNEAVQAALWQNTYMTWTPAPSNVGTWVGTGGATVGTAVNVAPTATNLYTQMRRSTFANVVTTTNQQVGIRSDAQFHRGTKDNMGGWFFACRFGFDVIPTGSRAFVGMSSTTVIVSSDPSTVANVCGFAFDAADNSWNFTHNSATVTASKEPISGGGTLATNNTGYDAYIWCAPNDPKIHYRLDRTDTGATLVESYVDTNLPVNTTMLMATAQMSNGTANTTANAVVLGINRLYVETNR